MTQERSHDKPLSEHTEVERQIIRYGFFRNTGRMEEAEECFRKIQAMLRSLPTAVPDCIGAQIANDTARALDDVAAKIMTGRNMAEKEARAVTSGARMLERLAIALPSAGADRLNPLQPHYDKLAEEVSRLQHLINTPELENFDKGVPLECAHQVERWGEAHDRSKSAENWYWLVGYLAGKALRASIAGDREKALHHTISAGAALRNWHRSIQQDTTGAGIGQDEDLEALASDQAPTGADS